MANMTSASSMNADGNFCLGFQNILGIFTTTYVRNCIKIYQILKNLTGYLITWREQYIYFKVHL